MFEKLNRKILKMNYEDKAKIEKLRTIELDDIIKKKNSSTEEELKSISVKIELKNQYMHKL